MPAPGLFSTRRARAAAREAAARAADDRALLTRELMARVRAIQIRTHKLVNTALSGGYRSTFRGSGVEFSEVRAYTPGDDVRRIDWNVTARTGEAFIKTYAEERELTLHLVVDQSRSMDFGSGEWTKREVAAQLASLITFVALRHQDRVGLSLFGERPGMHLPAKKGSQHLLRIVREVLASRATSPGSDFAAALEQEERLLRRRSVVFVVSDFLEGPGQRTRDWTQPLARLGLRHDLIAVRVFDPFESQLPAAGMLEFRELEGGALRELDTRSAAVRQIWAARAATRREELVATFARARADLLELDTTRDVGDSLRAFFRRRVMARGAPRR
ncbi:MAG: DUF58 domain-containing protein [Planctomycetes bacterium]|nr:DUF58 domain-containing protein [Planctomycetota bacterium]